MTIWVLGISHHNTPLDVRGRFTFTPDQLASGLRSLQNALVQEPAHQPAEAAIVSTCNRTEVYGTGDHTSLNTALQWLEQAAGVSVQVLNQYAYTLHDDVQATRHVFRVASGLDSMVLGETQISGQLKDAVQAAQMAGTLGVTLHQLFQRSFAVAKAVRNKTTIGAQSISMAAACVRLAAQIFENIEDIQLLFVGAGEMVTLTCTHFAAKNPHTITITNRNSEHGQALATRFAANYMPLGNLPECLHRFDAVISCTASTLPIIGLGAVESALRQRRHKPLLMVDLAVPRDIEAQVQALDNVFLYTLDDLAQIVQDGHSSRQEAVADAERIVEEGVQAFCTWLAQRAAVPVIQDLQTKVAAWQAQEIARAQRLLAKGESTQTVLAALARGLTQKILHGPITALRSNQEDKRLCAHNAVDNLFLGGKMPKRCCCPFRTTCQKGGAPCQQQPPKA